MDAPSTAPAPRSSSSSAAWWEVGYASLQAYVAREGHACVPTTHVEGGFRLGFWVSRKRLQGVRGSLAPSRVEALEALPGWRWRAGAPRQGDQSAEERWASHVSLLKVFCSREGHARVPRRHLEDGFALGVWVSGCRQNHRRGTLSAERTAQLEDFPGWVWKADLHRDERWLRHSGAFQAYFAREGHAIVPTTHVEGGLELGAWVRGQRARYVAGDLGAERVAFFESFPGWVWGRPRPTWWEDGLAALGAFTTREGHARVPRDHIEGDHFLGAWVVNRRLQYHRGALSPGRIAALEAHPWWLWDGSPDGARWPKGILALTAYTAREGDALVPGGHVEDGFRLGAWITARRDEFHAGTLSAERRGELEQFPGWAWSPSAVRTEKRMEALRKYVRRVGNARVHRDHVEDGIRLGLWVDRCRRKHRLGQLGADEASALEALPGWFWTRGHTSVPAA